MSTAIFGGTFDPVHMGHVKIALSAIEQFELDRLVIVPNANPPHKKNEVTADFHHRYNMLSLAFEGLDKVEISDYESKENRIKARCTKSHLLGGSMMIQRAAALESRRSLRGMQG